MDEVIRKLDEVILILKGDPVDQNKPGILTRIDRVERTTKSHKLLIFMVGGSLLTTICTIIVGVIFKYV